MPEERPATELTPESLTGLERGEPKEQAAGLPAVTNSLKHVYGQAGLVRGTSALLRLNQKAGFDCPSCAWPDPDDHRATTEFCENGAKAVASETTTRRADAAFFRKHSVEELARQSDYWHEQQGRLCEPLYLPKGASHYEPISWEQAFAKIASHLKDLSNPDEAIFYTSGRASNEAAFLYQLFARQFGTNNLPDCSNMCHESSGAALNASIGVGKGTVTLEDFYESELVVLLGQNPGTNHPRMLSALQECARNGGRIIAVNPLREAGLLGFAHPQEVQGILGQATPLATRYLQVKLNGDMALLRGLAKCILVEHAVRIDRDFIAEHTEGFEAWQAAVEATSWEQLESMSGLGRDTIEGTALELAGSRNAIFCWAMGLTQHANAVATIQEVVNLQLMLGNLGRPGAGLCPVRGHSNVQGDRTVGIYEKMPEWFLARLGEVYGIEVPRAHGYDTVAAIQAMHGQGGQVFIALGGNFLSAAPDTSFTAEALRRCRLTVQISTKLNRSHLVTGEEALILPCLGRSETDVGVHGPQFISMENSMGIVHRSQGRLAPISEDCRGEPAIVAGLGEALFGEGSVPWAQLGRDYGRIREGIETVIPGFAPYNERLEAGESFYLPNTAKELDFSGLGGRAHFHTHPLSQTQCEAEGELMLQTLRSHDQFNTTVYGLDDRYRGIYGERRVIFLNAQDMEARGLVAEQPVDITSHFGGKQRHARLFLAIPYDLPRGTAAAYFPEANVLVPIDSQADVSGTPTSKSVRITIAAAG